MNEGEIALTPLPQADGRTKPRPTVLLRRMPPFGDWLICGVSTQIHQRVVGFDETIEPLHPDFAHSGLKAASLIRLGFLTLPSNLVVKAGFIENRSRERQADDHTERPV